MGLAVLSVASCGGSSGGKSQLCNGQPSGAMPFAWAKNAGGEHVGGVAVSDGGTTAITGTFSLPVTFGKGEPHATMLTPALNSNDIYVAQLGSDGTLAWARRAGSTASDTGLGVAIASDGTTYVVGTFSGTALFGETDPSGPTMVSATGQSDAFVARYEHDGTVGWVRRIGGGQTDTVRTLSIAVAGDGSLRVLGSFKGTATFGPGEANQATFTAQDPQNGDSFVASFAGDGTFGWAARTTGTWLDQGHGFAIAPDGATYITGQLVASTAQFGLDEPSLKTLSTSGTAYLTRVEADGTIGWAKGFGPATGGTGVTEGIAIAVAPDQTAVVTGAFEGIAVFGAGEPAQTSFTSTGSPTTHDFFVARYASDGTLMWAKAAGSPLEDVGLGIAAASDGTLRVIGSFEGQITFGLGLPSAIQLTGESEDLFLANFDGDGNALHAKTVGTGPTRLATGIAVAPDASLRVAGTFQNTSTFGKGEPGAVTFTASVAQDQYVARYDTCP
jgi:hypothetical protein